MALEGKKLLTPVPLYLHACVVWAFGAFSTKILSSPDETAFLSPLIPFILEFYGCLILSGKGFAIMSTVGRRAFK